MSYRLQPKKRFPIGRVAAALLVVGLIAGIFIWLNARDNSTPQGPPTQPDQAQEPAPTEPEYEAIDLQPIIDEWVSKYSTDYHIAVYDLQADKIIGAYQPDTELFAASLYKLYVAYLMYKDFESGAQDPNEVILAGQTRLECADKMIRSSDSPCGETVMADMGQLTLNQRATNEIGTEHTIFNGIETSASDAISVLKLIHDKESIKPEHHEQLMDSLLDQPAMYRRGLASGAPEATWHTKVGWNLDINYHDVGFMTLPDGRVFAVAILGQGSGSPAPIADFAAIIYTTLIQQDH